MAELRADIVSEFKGKKAFKDADKATSTLDKSVKRLGKQLALTFGATQLLKFSKNAAKAFIEDQKEVTRLTQVVKNLGLAFEAPAIEDYIGKLSRLSGVTDSELRPSMQTLLQITGSVTKSQQMLAQAIDVSAGTGIDLSTVAQDLGRAYTGNTRGLRKYNLGLTQAELTTASYVDVQAKLEKLFGGTNAAQLGTYAGQMSLLSVAAGEAQETIGQGLIDAMITLTESKDVTDFVNKIDSVAQSISNAIGSVSRFIRFIKLLPTYKFGPNGEADPRAAAIFDPAQNATTVLSNNITNPSILQKQADIRKRAERDAARRQKAILDAQRKALLLQKQQVALSKASKTIDLERIGIEAALKGQISETDRLSLNLQLALLDKNESAALKLSAQLTTAVERQNALNAALLATPEAPNPYRNWKPPVFGPVMPEGIIVPKNPAAPPYGELVPDFNVPDYVKQGAGITGRSANDYLGLGAIGAGSTADTILNVVVNVDGDPVANAITSVQQNQSLSGTFSDVNRYSGRGAPSIR
jgi:hypothetical protein